MKLFKIMKNLPRNFFLGWMIFGGATNAVAKCHKYSIWHYKFPQTCGYKALAPIKLPPMKPAPIVIPSIEVPPMSSDDDLHQIGIEKLKEMQYEQSR